MVGTTHGMIRGIGVGDIQVMDIVIIIILLTIMPCVIAHRVHIVHIIHHRHRVQDEMQMQRVRDIILIVAIVIRHHMVQVIQGVEETM